jgi:hypothetical protein
MDHESSPNAMRMLCESLNRARSAEINEGRTKHANTQRSELWVRELAAGFSRAFDREQDVRVLWKYGSKSRAEFGLSELLYDVCVCRTKSCASATARKQLCYVHDVLWQVESEFAPNSREAVKDFNKLVLGSATNKLFVGPSGCQSGYLKSLLPVAQRCGGNVFTALVPHPAKWDQNGKLELWRLGDGTWQQISQSVGA